MISGVEVEHRFCPECSHQLDLLLLASPTISEPHAQRLVFQVVPTDANAQPAPVPAQHRQFGHLLGNQDDLALEQDHHLLSRGMNDTCRLSSREGRMRHRSVR